VPSGRRFSLLMLIAACAETAARAIKPVNVVTEMRMSASMAPPGDSVHDADHTT